MDTRRRLGWFEERLPSALKRIIGIGILLTAMSYGIAWMFNPATPPTLLIGGGGGTATHSPALPLAAAAEPVRQTAAPMRSSPEDGVDGEESPRACEPERGISERCTYN